MTGISKRLAQFVADLNYDDLPSDLVERVKLLILDISGIMVRARHDAESTPALINAVKRMGLTNGKCSVMGDTESYAPPAAALINGTLAHSLDFDDTHAKASIHSGAPIVPAALAAAEISSCSGREVITAIVAGFEVQIRLSLALNPSAHYEQGFHPTATFGVFGAASSAAKLLGQDEVGVRNAFGIALSQSAGSMQFLTDGAWTKRSHVGQAAQNGLMCAFLSAEGFKGVDEPFEGKWGFFHSYAPNSEGDKATAELGATWETMSLAVKPYPSCRYTHAAMDAMTELLSEHKLDWTDIDEIEIGLPQTGWNLTADPLSHKQHPKNVVDGQFSMPFCAAVILREGGMTWDDYAKHLNDQDTRALCAKVDVVVDPLAEEEFPANMAGVARIKTNGKTYERFVAVPKGEPENFMSQAEFRAKFEGLCEPYLGSTGANQLANTILTLEETNSIKSVMELSRPQ